MAVNPYHGASPHRLWRRAVSIQGAETDPVHAFPFTVSTTDAVVTAGSCFAQHISRRLAASGYKFLITEAAHPFLEPDTAAAFNYGRFTARYGNIYTARQLLQLFHRAYGTFTPVEDAWRTDTGAWIDPFRPQIQPGGFPTEAEYRADREQHFAAVRTAFETADVFIFTLGLTECWEHAVDGAAFPICPGTSAGGVFDPEVHRFANHSVSDVIEDMEAFFGALRAMNPQVRVILTVSPVPLVATARDAHVLVATTYSKSVLRVAAETLVSRHEKTGYFPSYEIITGPQSRGATSRMTYVTSGPRAWIASCPCFSSTCAKRAGKASRLNNGLRPLTIFLNVQSHSTMHFVTSYYWMTEAPLTRPNLRPQRARDLCLTLS